MNEHILEGIDVVSSAKARIKDDDLNDSCFPRLTLTEKLIAFGVFNALGILLQMGALVRLLKAIASNDEEHFALVYSMGNVLSIIGTMFLVGVKKQLDDLVDPNRRMISFVYFGSIIFSIIVALSWHGVFAKFLVCVGVLVQTVAFWWYVLSYIPCGRRIAGGCLSCIRSIISGNW